MGHELVTGSCKRSTKTSGSTEGGEFDWVWFGLVWFGLVGWLVTWLLS
jgi:hypothetical protein